MAVVTGHRFGAAVRYDFSKMTGSGSEADLLPATGKYLATATYEGGKITFDKSIDLNVNLHNLSKKDKAELVDEVTVARPSDNMKTSAVLWSAHRGIVSRRLRCAPRVLFQGHAQHFDRRA